MLHRFCTRINASVIAGGALVALVLTALHLSLAERDAREIVGDQALGIAIEVARLMLPAGQADDT